MKMRTALSLVALRAPANAFSPSFTQCRLESALRAQTGWEKRSDFGTHSPIASGVVAGASHTGNFIGAPKSHLRDFDRRVIGSGHEVGAPGDDWFRESRGGRDLTGGRVSSYSGPWKLAGSSATGSTIGSADVAMSPVPSAASDGRRPIVAGNWKLNPATWGEARGLLKKLAANFAGAGIPRASEPEVVIFPPLPYISDALHLLRGTGIGVGAQNSSPHEKGAFTGEIAPSMLASAGCSHVLLGHSERRTLFGETDEHINECLLRCLDQPSLTVILCVGETLEEYENGLLENVVDYQIREGLRGVDPAALLNDRLVVAYEPVWAIGTGLVATPEQAQAAHVAVRNSLESLYGSSELARGVRIQYGGSVTPASIEQLMGEDDVDGALVGGASLDADSFAQIFVGAAKANERKHAGAR